MSDITLDLARTAVRFRARWTLVELVFWIAAAACYVLFPGKLVLLTQILIGGLFAMSLDLLLGYGGIPSFGHAAFFGLGAYTAGLLAAHGWGEPISGVLAAGLVTGALGFAFSTLIAKVRGAAVLMVTLCIGLLLYEGASRLPWLTGGDSGLQGIEMWPLLGLFEFDLFGRTAFWYAYCSALTLYLVARRYVHSPEGLALQAIRENQTRVPMLGVSITRRKMIAFTISAARRAAGADHTDRRTGNVELRTIGVGPRHADRRRNWHAYRRLHWGCRVHLDARPAVDGQSCILDVLARPGADRDRVDG
ncbi:MULTISPECIES: branched-chain amino acid ABC transporter permease [Bradyrhizobium]|uniref:Branched-chain amino acid ABC transporter permease n=3 Tax=Bradyrhizobium TaxID=374 RepID=A0AAE5X8N5_9BRAD|nr:MULTISPECIES: branched-chain amino acid ABC transporter permease [Bradyrhizobium]MCG2628211.1 branched-chain amino acid ABC transporter permease [Bradyrhizobium zhengyangense]MCG2643330.1 branched-chain amino acid ABC transporter permease [Bradyrhizobium zhengyangense]MCG2670356.1 branched-chain amino acid ABC transporter permease [Bradyrhizobium zhengyangense]MDN4985909.1 branched-chain amino acid ABC transporter permease [Bradyrhizobium sp. WYCCWR 13022]MDN5002712.1 branched-chain amino a